MCVNLITLPSLKLRAYWCLEEKSKPPRRVGTDVTAYCARKSFDAVKAQQAAL